MRQIGLIAVVSSMMFAIIGCADSDYCSCSYAHRHLQNIGFYISHPRISMWCPANDPQNDARIVKLMGDHCVEITYPFTPFGKSGLQPIIVSFSVQEKCAKKLISEAASRGEIKVVFEDFNSVVERSGVDASKPYYLAPPGIYGLPRTQPQ